MGSHGSVMKGRWQLYVEQEGWFKGTYNALWVPKPWFWSRLFMWIVPYEVKEYA